MKKLPLVYHREYSPEFDPDHRFPMQKFALLFEHLSSTGLIQQCEVFSPERASPNDISQAHDHHYISDFLSNQLSWRAMRRIGIPWSEGVMNRTVRAVGGSLLTTKLALEFGLAAHLAGGTHHAHYDEGSGFCIFNDLAICARYALTQPKIHRVMIIDADVHQGDGTARILENDSDIITVSFHCKQNFPARKAQSDHDIELEHGTSDDEYLAVLKAHIPYLLSIHNPDFVIYDGGADPHTDDALGLLALSDEGLRQRDMFVLGECAERDIPVSCVIGGGYMKDRQRLAEVHGILHHSAFEIWQQFYS